MQTLLLPAPQTCITPCFPAHPMAAGTVLALLVACAHQGMHVSTATSRPFPRGSAHGVQPWLAGPCRGHSSSDLLGKPPPAISCSSPGLGVLGLRVPAPGSLSHPALPTKNQRFGYIWMLEGLRAWPLGHLQHPQSPLPGALPLQKYTENSRERQRRREKERQRLCLHAPVQSSLLMRRIWLLVSRGVCPVG